ncbi:MAG: nicotinate-nucleotide--dimethylbenzimidazole phosphoribosyltransferase [Deltaproteobacteria bacterium SG8_13]|nr:MAG: nicotinate-nucleotide--dimethylbenzimidazole phosphoribosyltransferase [Deltaproteobacteria bacterium SG8_13]
MEPIDPVWIQRARERTAALLMPARALGRLHQLAEQLCGIRRSLHPSIGRKAFLIMAGDHGIVEEGVSAYPQEVTGEMIKVFLAGGAGINILAGQVGAQLHVVDMGVKADPDLSGLDTGHRFISRKVARGTANFVHGPAMKREQAEEAVSSGFQLATELFDNGVEMLGTGDMGIGNTTPSAAIGAVITGADLEAMVGRGTGIDDRSLERKIEVVRRGIHTTRPDAADGMDVLAKVGGFEIGGIAGCILAGAFHRRPVVIDGFISTAGALIATVLAPAAIDFMLAGHCSEEPGHRLMLQHLGLSPILDLGMRLGEGSGGALAMGIIEAAARIFREMATFEEAGVSGKE